MDRNFKIPICNVQVEVSMEDEGKAFLVHLLRSDVVVVLTEDTEGAQHWFEKERENETVLSRKIGNLIEAEIQNQQVDNHGII